MWFTQPSKDFSFEGRPYQVPGGAVCFPREKIGRELLLNSLRIERDVWTGDEATVKARLIERIKKLKA